MKKEDTATIIVIIGCLAMLFVVFYGAIQLNMI